MVNRVTDSLPDTHRQNVIAAAMEAFSRQPYDEISVEGIALVAGVPDQDCYRHYGSKLGIYLAALRQALRDVIRSVAREGPSDPRARLRYGLRTYMDYVSVNPERHLYLSAAAIRGDGVEARFRDDLRSTVTRALVGCVGEERGESLVPLLPGWVALAESMLYDWGQRGVPSRDDLETVLCDLFFAVVETTGGGRV